MPLVKIHMIEGVRTPEEVREVADVIQDVSIKTLSLPPKDRAQIVTQHKPYEIYCEESPLGFERTEKLLIVQFFLRRRPQAVKLALYGELMAALASKTGLKEGDLVVTCSDNENVDWSFGAGKAQFNTGEL